MAAISNSIRQRVAERAAHCCEYCIAQANYAPDYFSIEHVVPLAKGGSNHLDNLAYACLACNSHKYTFTHATDPVTGLEAPLFHPRQDTWSHHFRWGDDLTIIVGLTAQGRATVEKLNLNRPSLRNLRAVLVKVGKHPPIFTP